MQPQPALFRVARRQRANNFAFKIGVVVKVFVNHLAKDFLVRHRAVLIKVEPLKQFRVFFRYLAGSFKQELQNFFVRVIFSKLC